MNVTGSVQLRNDIYHMMVRYETGNNKYKQASKSTRIRIGSTAKEKKENKRKAELMLAEWIEEIKKQAPTSDQLFLDAVSEWMERKKQDVRQNSFESYESYVKNHIKPYWSEKNPKISEITVRDIQRYIDYEHNNNISAQSIKKYLVVINGVFDDAVRYGEISTNPCDKAVLPKSKKFRGSAYSVADAERLIKGINNEQVKPAIMIALYLGLRRSEIVGLRWSDIDFKADIVHIQNTVVRFKTWVEEEHTKSEASRRDLYLPTALKNYLLRLKAEQNLNEKLCGRAYKNSGHVCQHADGSAFTPDYIYYHYKKIQKELNLPDIRLHDLRHTAGSILINNGVTIKQVQAFLGHEKASTTLDIYAHINNEGKEETAKVMDDILAVGC